jgi:acetyl-CoA carboxylase carboxyl transferase subunit alpha
LPSLLDFESSLRHLEHELENVRGKSSNGSSSEQQERLQADIESQLRGIYSSLTAWQKVQVSRHRERPYALDYLQWGFSDFVELHGDRSFADDRAIIGGPAVLDGRTVMIIGQQKGRDTRENVERNFGMPHPEGYRKAERLMRQAERLSIPVVTLIDIPGASASLQDEERGQSEAIASSISTMLALKIPTVAVVIGEGGSGGALAIACADRLYMLEYATFTVASPEAAAAILWRDAVKAPEAAQNMKITADDLMEMGFADGIIREPIGGAHRDRPAAAKSVAELVTRALNELESLPLEELLARRYEKYRDIGFFRE